MVEDDLLYHYDEVGGHRVKQLCVPFGRRLQVMRLAHDTIAAGHLASRKTRTNSLEFLLAKYENRGMLLHRFLCTLPAEGSG